MEANKYRYSPESHFHLQSSVAVIPVKYERNLDILHEEKMNDLCGN